MQNISHVCSIYSLSENGATERKNATYLRFSGKWKMKFQAEEMNRRKKQQQKQDKAKQSKRA